MVFGGLTLWFEQASLMMKITVASYPSLCCMCVTVLLVLVFYSSVFLCSQAQEESYNVLVRKDVNIVNIALPPGECSHPLKVVLKHPYIQQVGLRLRVLNETQHDYTVYPVSNLWQMYETPSAEDTTRPMLQGKVLNDTSDPSVAELSLRACNTPSSGLMQGDSRIELQVFNDTKLVHTVHLYTLTSAEDTTGEPIDDDLSEEECAVCLSSFNCSVEAQGCSSTDVSYAIITVSVVIMIISLFIVIAVLFRCLKVKWTKTLQQTPANKTRREKTDTGETPNNDSPAGWTPGSTASRRLF